MLGVMTFGHEPVCRGRFVGFALTFAMLLGNPARSTAQTVSPDINIRDSALAGSATDFTAAFEPGATYVAWRDSRDNVTSSGDIYVQKIGLDGGPLGELNGLGICTAEGNQRLPAITPDGAGGAVVVWLDGRDDRWNAIAGQRISASGAVQWNINGEFIGVVLLERPRPFVHRASDGGFPVTSWDAEPFFDPDDDMLALLAQKLDPELDLDQAGSALSPGVSLRGNEPVHPNVQPRS